MKDLLVSEVALIIREFVKDTAPQLPVELDYGDGKEPEITYLSVQDMLATWSQLPDSAYGYMFIGWAIGIGLPMKSLPPALVEKGVLFALTGHEGNVAYFADYQEGVGDGTRKPN